MKKVLRKCGECAMCRENLEKLGATPDPQKVIRIIDNVNTKPKMS